MIGNELQSKKQVHNDTNSIGSGRRLLGVQNSRSKDLTWSTPRLSGAKRFVHDVMNSRGKNFISVF